MVRWLLVLSSALGSQPAGTGDCKVAGAFALCSGFACPPCWAFNMNGGWDCYAYLPDTSKCPSFSKDVSKILASELPQPTAIKTTSTQSTTESTTESTTQSITEPTTQSTTQTTPQPTTDSTTESMTKSTPPTSSTPTPTETPEQTSPPISDSSSTITKFVPPNKSSARYRQTTTVYVTRTIADSSASSPTPTLTLTLTLFPSIIYGIFA
ncbi:hypothetical protein DSO57_1008726 [Entomophthora muscae]|uniref:Uncharacterized protein n=1 Tax=Entomophthora muscae TaxID=34485 RepID=A0ACC2THW1_9FUNG|nr:hypothetical protein DSO57_1008726 [Entomophthora muscae]